MYVYININIKLSVVDQRFVYFTPKTIFVRSFHCNLIIVTTLILYNSERFSDFCPYHLIFELSKYFVKLMRNLNCASNRNVLNFFE